MRDLKPLDISILERSDTISDESINVLLNNELENLQKKIIVLDDDPTGTQTVHDVFVYTDWEKETLKKAFRNDDSLFFILTNSRSFSAEYTQTVHKEIAQNILFASKETNQEFILISRGDSTLRGHYPLETETLREHLETENYISYDGEIICPFFSEGGRFTIDNIHYVKENDKLIPAGLTEFAKDKSFGYASSHLGDYVEEKSGGKYKSENSIYISLEELRAQDIDGITKKLLSVNDFSKIIVNATTYTELKIFVISWIQAIKQGKNFLVRSAAAIPKVIVNIKNIPLLKKSDVVDNASNHGGIVIIGSHVKKTTQQLNALLELKESKKDLIFIEFDVNTYFKDGSLESETSRVLEKCNRLISEGKTVVIYTSRELKVPDNNSTDKDEILALSVKISDALTKIINLLSVKPQFIIAKGGITSSDVATKGLCIKSASVMGQIKLGIPVWKTQSESKFPNMPYIIFPGNVGEVSTLREIVEELI